MIFPVIVRPSSWAIVFLVTSVLLTAIARFNRLRLTPLGLEVRSIVGTLRFKWTCVSPFDGFSYFFIPLIGFDVEVGKRGVLCFVNQILCGRDMTLYAGHYGVPGQKLLDLLNRYHAVYGGEQEDDDEG